MIITLTGENQYAIKQALAGLVDDFVSKVGAHGVERIDGEDFEPRDLPSLLQGASLFAPRRLVVLQNPAANKPLWEALAGQVSSLPSETTLVIVEPAPDKRTRTYKVLKSEGDFKEFGQTSDGELVRWAQAEAKKRGTELSLVDSQYLVQRAGRDQWRLSTELAKLAGSGPRITRQAIDDLVEPGLDATAFALLDAALAGDTDGVARMVGALKNQEDPYKLVGLLASQVHALALAAYGGSRSADQIARDAGLHPFVVRKSQAAAKKLGAKAVGRIAEIVASCDFQLKSTGAEPWLLLEITLQKITQPISHDINRK